MKNDNFAGASERTALDGERPPCGLDGARSLPSRAKQMLLAGEVPVLGLGLGADEIVNPAYQRVRATNWSGPWTWKAGPVAMTADCLLVFSPSGERVWVIPFPVHTARRGEFVVQGPLVHLYDS